MAAKHFRSGEDLPQQEASDSLDYRPKHGSGKAKAQVTAEGWSAGRHAQPQVESTPATAANQQRSSQGAQQAGASGTSVRAGRGTGWYYGEPVAQQTGRSAEDGSSRPRGAAGTTDSDHTHTGPSRRILAACLGGACVVAVVAGLGIWSSHHGTGGTANSGQTATEQQVEQADSGNTAAGPSSADANGSSTNSNDAPQEDDATSGTLEAADVASRLSSLSHAGSDCSLPTDGAEVDVRDGHVLVAYQSADDAQGTVSRMTAAAAALAQELSGSMLSDSSTATDGVSQVPAVSTSAAIASSKEGSAFSGVEVVALGQGRYVIGAVSLASADGIGDAGESAILQAATSYAIEGPAYRYSGLYSRGIAQSKGDAPALLTGERLIMRMSVPQPTQTTTSSSASTSTNGRATASTHGGSTSTSASTSRNTTGTRSSSRSGSASTGTSGRRGTGYSSGGSGYASGSGYGTGGYAGSGYGTGGGAGGSASGSARSGSAGTQGRGAAATQ